MGLLPRACEDLLFTVTIWKSLAYGAGGLFLNLFFRFSLEHGG